MREPVTYCDIVEEPGIVTVALPAAGLDPALPTRLVLTPAHGLEVEQDGRVFARVMPFSPHSAELLAKAALLVVVEAGEDLSVTVHRNVLRTGFR